MYFHFFLYPGGKTQAKGEKAKVFVFWEMWRGLGKSIYRETIAEAREGILWTNSVSRTFIWGQIFAGESLTKETHKDNVVNNMQN